MGKQNCKHATELSLCKNQHEITKSTNSSFKIVFIYNKQQNNSFYNIAPQIAIKKIDKIDKHFLWKLWIGPYHNWSECVRFFFFLLSVKHILHRVGWQYFMQDKEVNP